MSNLLSIGFNSATRIQVRLIETPPSARSAEPVVKLDVQKVFRELTTTYPPLPGTQKALPHITAQTGQAPGAGISKWELYPHHG